jgi:hypothetical protein
MKRKELLEPLRSKGLRYLDRITLPCAYRLSALFTLSSGNAGPVRNCLEARPQIPFVERNKPTRERHTMKPSSKLALGLNVLMMGGLAVITAQHIETASAAYEAAQAERAFCSAPGIPASLRCTIASAARNVPAPVLAAVAWQESRFRLDVCSPAGACGLFQFMPETASAYGVERSSAESSAKGADVYLGKLERRFGNLGLALAAYNWGQGNLAKWLATKGAKTSSVPSETRAYVLAITGHQLESFLGKAAPRSYGGRIAALDREMKKPGAR